MQRNKKIYYGCIFIYLAVLGYSMYDNFTKGYTHSLTMCFVSLSLLFVVPIIFKVMKWKPVYEIYTVAIVFMFLSSVLGSAYRFYNHVLYWDKFVHCFSGILGVIVGYLLFCLLKKVKKANKEDVALLLIFVNAINITIAIAWELFEYAGLVFFDYDGIRHYTSGVHDSMGDIIVCIVGGFLSTYFIIRYYKSNKSNFIINVYEKFYTLNKKNR